MRHLSLFTIMLIVIVLVGCAPVSNDSSPLEEPSDLSGSAEFEPENRAGVEENNLDLVTIPESDEVQVELMPTSPQGSEESQVEPTKTEEVSTMNPNNRQVSDPDKLSQVQMAKEDLANRLNITIDEIEIITVELVTWPNSGMGCPQPGMLYKQVPVDGLLIRLSVEGVPYNYHSGGTRDPFLCQPSPTEKSTPPGLNLEDYITPPPGNIDE